MSGATFVGVGTITSWGVRGDRRLYRVRLTDRPGYVEHLSEHWDPADAFNEWLEAHPDESSLDWVGDSDFKIVRRSRPSGDTLYCPVCKGSIEVDPGDTYPLNHVVHRCGTGTDISHWELPETIEPTKERR